MGFTPEQIKGRIKSVAKQNNADARTLMRIYMMERFLERLAQSEYRDNFIIKGGMTTNRLLPYSGAERDRNLSGRPNVHRRYFRPMILKMQYFRH